MNNIIRFYNQNRKQFWIILLIIAFILFGIQFLNRIVKDTNSKNQSTNSNVVVEDTYVKESKHAVVSDTNISTKQAEKNVSIIDTFVEYCNNQNIEEAYNLISTECKEELYQTVEDFKLYYYDQVFTSVKTHSMQSWISKYNQYTYKVKLLEDILSTGKYEDTNTITDYFTVINENGEEKLNINSYVKKEDINIDKEINGIKITIAKKHVYMDYEKYVIQIENNSTNDMALDSKEKISGIYLIDENEKTYTSYIDEFLIDELIVKSGEIKTIELKFNKMYNLNSNIKYMVLSDVLQDYGKYESLDDKSQYGERVNVKIEVQ